MERRGERQAVKKAGELQASQMGEKRRFREAKCYD